MNDRSAYLNNLRRIVIKVGSQVLTRNGDLDEEAFEQLTSQFAALRRKGHEVAVVSSGAIAAGRYKLGLKERPKTIPLKQATAACGQAFLMHNYSKRIHKEGFKAAQVLLTSDDLSNRRRFLNARNTLLTLFEMGNVIPVINENDTVVVEEIKFGDNDRLSALVTNLIEADLLIILSDIDGFYDADPSQKKDAARYSFIGKLTENHYRQAGTTKTDVGTGGMVTKLEAARQAALSGASTVIASGMEKDTILRIVAGEDVGTFIAAGEGIGARKHWIAYSSEPKGDLLIDAGAVTALAERGKSLLPSGIKEVRGHFGIGDPVRCMGPEGKEVARGLVCYSSDDLREIAGRKTSEIEEILGYKYYDEVIHRNDLVVTLDHKPV